MKQPSALNWLIPLLILLTVISAGAGLFWQNDSGKPYTFTTLHGETVEIYGRGLYAEETIFSAGAAQGTDMAALFVFLPLLGVAFLYYRRGSLRGGIFLAGVLSCVLYYGASRGLDTTYNNLFLVYIALFSTSFLAFVLSLTAFDLQTLPTRILPNFPRRGMAILMFVAGMGTAFLWLSDVVTALANHGIPTGLGTHTTIVTYMIDVGIIIPATLLAGVQLLQRKPLGFLLASVLTIMLALIGVLVICQTIMQYNAGLRFSLGVWIGMVGSWIVMGGFAIWLTFVAFRNLLDSEDFSAPSKNTKNPDKLDEKQAAEIAATWNLLNPP